MKVLLAHDFYQNFGGEDSIALREKDLLEQNRTEVHFYSRDNNEIKDYTFLQKLRFIPRTIYSGFTVSSVEEIIREFNPDVAYTHNIFPLISPSIYRVLDSKAVPSVQNVQDFRWLCPNGLFYIKDRVCERCKGGAYWNAVRYCCFRNSYLLSGLYATAIGVNRAVGLLNKISAVVCATQFSKQKFIEAGIDENRLYIKPNFIDTSNIEPAFGTGNYIVFLGRLSQEKGLWTLIRAFEKMRDIQLRVVGTGPLEESLRTYVKEKNLINIKMEGFKRGSEKTDLLKNALFMVFTSEWYEHFPIVILESFATGKPIVTSRLGNMPFIIENGKSGLHYEAGEEDDLIEKVKTLIDNPAEISKMGRYARHLVETIYSPEENMKILRSIFSEVS